MTPAAAQNHSYCMDSKPTTAIALALLGLGLVSASVAADANSPSQEVTDQQVTEHIRDELKYDSVVDAGSVTVRTAGGIVTLGGEAPHLLTKQRAERIAEAVRGVRSVINRIGVKTSSRTDEQISKDIHSELSDNPATEPYEVGVTVEDGVVRLVGETDSWQERLLVGKAVAGVRGVSRIDNDIIVDYGSERPDDELQREIMQSLRWSIYVDHDDIDVTVEDGHVKLTGTVRSAVEKTDARLAALVAGVNSVDASGLKVEESDRDPQLRKQKYQVRDDEAIRQAVFDTIAIDPRVSLENIICKVELNTVTLTGTVDNLRAKRAAGNDARNTAGVFEVENRLIVRSGEPLSDTEIASRLGRAFDRHVLLDDDDIAVSVSDGVVGLFGEVDAVYEKRTADDIASRLAGVVRVRNALNLDTSLPHRPATWDPWVDNGYLYDYDWYGFDTAQKDAAMASQSDADIREQIYDQLFWSPFVDANEVTVTVEDETATLTGEVDSWSERQAAEENAHEGGAVRVVNRLVLESGM